MAQMTIAIFAAVLTLSVIVISEEEVKPLPTKGCRPIKCGDMVPCTKYKKDQNGCQTCDCLCYKFSLMCPQDCMYGVAHYIDDNGCKHCDCAAKPEKLPAAP